MVYGAKTWSIKTSTKDIWSGGDDDDAEMDGSVTRKDKIRIDYIRGTVGVVELSKMIQQIPTTMTSVVWPCHAKRALGM